MILNWVIPKQKAMEPVNLSSSKLPTKTLIKATALHAEGGHISKQTGLSAFSDEIYFINKYQADWIRCKYALNHAFLPCPQDSKIF